MQASAPAQRMLYRTCSQLPLLTMLQGVLTPFDRLEGFERRVQSRGQDTAAAEGTAGQPGLQGAGNMLRLLGLVYIADGLK